MPILANEIVDIAVSYVTPEDICYEKSENKGNCINDLKCYYKNHVDNCATSEIGNEAYCAITAWVVVEKACKNLNVKNFLPKTKGALDMLTKAKQYKQMSVNNTPAVGSVFYRKSEAKGSTGHIGIVVQLENDVFHTVEGNMSFEYQGKEYSGVWTRYYSYSDISKRGFQFIHTEQMALDEAIEIISSPVTLLIIAGIAAGVWYFFKK